MPTVKLRHNNCSFCMSKQHYKVDCYQATDTTLDGDGEFHNNVGHKIILPSSFTVEPCYMSCLTLGSMGSGNSDLFITMHNYKSLMHG